MNTPADVGSLLFEADVITFELAGDTPTREERLIAALAAQLRQTITGKAQAYATGFADGQAAHSRPQPTGSMYQTGDRVVVRYDASPEYGGLHGTVIQGGVTAMVHMDGSGDTERFTDSELVPEYNEALVDAD